jgi:hypothetical protein
MNACAFQVATGEDRRGSDVVWEIPLHTLYSRAAEPIRSREASTIEAHNFQRDLAMFLKTAGATSIAAGIQANTSEQLLKTGV